MTSSPLDGAGFHNISRPNTAERRIMRAGDEAGVRTDVPPVNPVTFKHITPTCRSTEYYGICKILLSSKTLILKSVSAQVNQCRTKGRSLQPSLGGRQEFIKQKTLLASCQSWRRLRLVTGRPKVNFFRGDAGSYKGSCVL